MNGNENSVVALSKPNLAFNDNGDTNTGFTVVETNTAVIDNATLAVSISSSMDVPLASEKIFYFDSYRSLWYLSNDASHTNTLHDFWFLAWSFHVYIGSDNWINIVSNCDTDGRRERSKLDSRRHQRSTRDVHK